MQWVYFHAPCLCPHCTSPWHVLSTWPYSLCAALTSSTIISFEQFLLAICLHSLFKSVLLLSAPHPCAMELCLSLAGIQSLSFLLCYKYVPFWRSWKGETCSWTPAPFYCSPHQEKALETREGRYSVIYSDFLSSVDSFSPWFSDPVPDLTSVGRVYAASHLPGCFLLSISWQRNPWVLDCCHLYLPYHLAVCQALLLLCFWGVTWHGASILLLTSDFYSSFGRQADHLLPLKRNNEGICSWAI